MAYLGDRYVRHNPWVLDGPEGFRRVIAEGDLVVLPVHSVRTPGTPGEAIVDIFRVEDAKVVEHWDVIQDIPEPLYPPTNPNSLF